MVSGQAGISLETYDRAVSYMWENVNNKKAFNLHIQPNWFSDSSGIWYEWQSVNNKKFQKITFPDLRKSDLFNHHKLASILSDSLDEEIKANNLPISQVEYLNKNEIGFMVKGKKYHLELISYSVTLPEPEPDEKEFEKLSPDKKWIAIPKDYNLFIKSTETGETIQLSSSGSKNYEYASWYEWGDIIEGEEGERPRHFDAKWSKDSEWLYTNICDLRTAQKMYLLDWSQDSLYRPRLLSYYRG